MKRIFIWMASLTNKTEDLVFEKPKAFHQRELYLIKCTVWSVVMSEEVIGFSFLTITLGIMSLLPPAIKDKHDIWFQQNGTTAHAARAIIQLSRKIFEGRIISCGSDISWPSRSPDLTISDSFLWGYLKEIKLC